MHFIILIPIILLFKLILWLLGITIVVSSLKAFGEFVFKYKIPFSVIIILVSSYFVFLITQQTANNHEVSTYVEPPPIPKPNYNEKLKHHKKYHNNILITESLKLHHKRGEEVQFTITLKNKNNKSIKRFNGTLLVWDKNNKYIGDYDFSELEALPTYQDGMRWDDKNKQYVDIKESDNWIFPNKSLTFDFAYNDESITNYNFKNFKYLVCHFHAVFEDGTEYRDK